MPEHISVLLSTVLEVLDPKDSKTYFDGTFGGGGYTKAILNASNCNVIATDRDEYVQQFAKEVKDQYGDRFDFHHAKFREIKSVLNKTKQHNKALTTNFLKKKSADILYDMPTDETLF